MRANIKKALLILFILAAFCPYHSSALTGYCIDVTVDNSTHWTRCQSSQVLIFNADSSSKGDGNYSKYMKVDGFAGIGMKELTSTDTGRLIEESKISVESDEPTVHIVETARNNSSVYNAYIEENFPTYATSNGDLYYRGKAIRNINYYTNNADKAYTEFGGSTLTKSSKYLAARTNSLVKAEIRAGSTNVLDLTNYATAFRIASQTNRYAAFKFQSDDQCIDEEYRGSSRMNIRAVNSHKYNTTLIEDWLSCCPTLELKVEDYLDEADFQSGTNLIS